MRSLLAISLLALTSLMAEPPRPVVHVRNFGTVNEHILRGAEPAPAGLIELNNAGVKLVIDLRVAGEGTKDEKDVVEKLGMKYTNIPLPPSAAPSPGEVRTVLNLLAANASKTVFLHCRRGKDRTGTIVACYRIQHDGWQNARALEEARSYGMSSLERGMKEFILHFTPLSNASDPSLLSN